MDRQPSDEALMLAYKAGDAAAFEELYSRWRGRLYRYLKHQCGPTVHADEIFQEVWLKVVKARIHYEVSAKFSTWLYRIAHNQLVDAWRAAGRKALDQLASYDEEDLPLEEREAFAAPEGAAPDRWLERKDLAERLSSALSTLPAAQRETFLLMEEGEMTLEEIAAATQTSRETAKSRLRYALAKLRAALEDLR